MNRREEILAALDSIEVALSGTHYVADALLPVVDRLCAEAAAEALTDAAADSPWYSSEHGPVVPVWRLRNRADAALTGRAAVRTQAKGVTP